MLCTAHRSWSLVTRGSAGHFLVLTLSCATHCRTQETTSEPRLASGMDTSPTLLGTARSESANAHEAISFDDSAGVSGGGRIRRVVLGLIAPRVFPVTA